LTQAIEYVTIVLFVSGVVPVFFTVLQERMDAKAIK